MSAIKESLTFRKETQLIYNKNLYCWCRKLVWGLIREKTQNPEPLKLGMGFPVGSKFSVVRSDDLLEILWKEFL